MQNNSEQARNRNNRRKMDAYVKSLSHEEEFKTDAANNALSKKRIRRTPTRTVSRLLAERNDVEYLGDQRWKKIVVKSGL